MDFLHAQADAVRSAVASVSTCSPTTVAQLNHLLLPHDEQPPPPPPPALATEKTTKAPRSRSNTAPAPAADTRRTTKTTKASAAAAATKNGLGAKDRANLASHVLNAALKALIEARKAQRSPPVPAKPTQEGDLAKTATRNALRRSSSAPMTPLQPRTLNRTATSPVAVRHARSPSKSGNTNMPLLALAECARVCTAAIRHLVDVERFPGFKDLELETSMSRLVENLVALELHDLAIKELRILKKRLEARASPEAKKTTKGSNPDPKSASQGFVDILDFGQVKASGAVLALIIATQMQVLRILSSTKRPSSVEAAISYLQNKHISSPIDLLLLSAKETGADVAKIARQMDVVDQCLRVLAPVVKDGRESESKPGIFITPALDLHTLAIQTRLHSWRLSNRSGDVDKEVMLPLSRCLGLYVKWSREFSRALYQRCLKVFDSIYQQLRAQGLKPSGGTRYPLASIYQTLSTLARECGNLSDAVSWATKLRELVDSEVDSAAKSSSIASHLLSLHLMDAAEYIQDDQLLKEVLAALLGPLRGNTTEVDELLTNFCLVRKSAAHFLVQLDKGKDGGVFLPVPTARDLAETFILQCPRFCRRWLGNPPGPKSSTKDFLRYDQRRQTLIELINPTLDSAFWIIHRNEPPWDITDSILGDCTTLLEDLGKLATPDSETLYYVKISNFYYRQYLSLRQKATDRKDAAPLRALRRSVECVKHRPSAEKEKAHLIVKLELMADLCKELGRGEEALGAFRTIRTSLVEDGVLEAIAHNLTVESPKTAWTQNGNAERLSRVLCSISKTEQVWVDWTIDLPEAQQAAIQEHQLHFVLLGSGKGTSSLTLEHPAVDTLLRTYIPTRFPIRRFRVLLALLCSAVGRLNTSSELLSIAKDASQLEAHPDYGEDAGLAGFIPHMKAFYHSLTASIDGYRDLGAFQESLSIWRSILTQCQSRTVLGRLVDDVPGLLIHLQSVADFFRMKGLDSILATVLELAADITKVVEGPTAEDFIHHNSALALQYTILGQSTKAEQIFLKAQEYVGRQETVRGEAVAYLHLSFAEHLFAVGNVKKAEEYLSLAQLAFHADASLDHKAKRFQRKRLAAHASYLHSLVALERGDSHHALIYSRDSMRSLLQDWMRLEGQLDVETLAEESSDTNTSFNMSTTEEKDDSESPPLSAGPEFWSLFPSLYRNILRLSAIYAHLGMFQETVYYAEQAQKIAKSADTEFYKAHCATWMGSVYVRAADHGKSLEMLQEASARLPDDDQSYSSALLACQVASMYLELNSSEEADIMIAKAEAIMESLTAVVSPEKASEIAALEDKIATMRIDDKPARTTRKTVRQAPVRKTAKGASVAKPKAVAALILVAPEEDTQLAKLRASILVQKASSTLGRKEWIPALALLKEATQASKQSDLLSMEQVAMATCLLGMSMEQMAHDPVFSVIHDSTISFPAILGPALDKPTADRISVGKASPPRKTRSGASAGQRDVTIPRAYVDTLREAQEYLIEAHSVATLSGDASLVHRISGMLQNVGLFLAATSAKGRIAVHSVHTSYSVELGRNLTWRRERKAIMIQKHAPKPDLSDWPAALGSVGPKRSSLGFSLDLHKFQRDYIDIIPKPWHVISISLSDNKHDLCITKLQAGQSPFVIRLPLERASSRDADNIVFNFQQGRSELLEVIGMINESCHHKGDVTAPGAKTAWWESREALDERLRDLLENIEQIWLGGFRGIFSQHTRRPDLLARFQKSFLNILDKHLPSRRQVRGKKTKAAVQGGTKVTLDPRILELFIGLGNTAAEVSDLEDELTDLLYFVVDILQFHGETNAYDEIDFDSMVVETFDALQSYHTAARGAGGLDSSVHTILMLDKALHAFPWESLSCLRNLGISRVPSLACLRRLILEQRAAAGHLTTTGSSNEGDEPAPRPTHSDGHHVSRSSGSYIINPSSDLKMTEGAFVRPLTTHLPAPAWTQILGRVPTEDEFERALSEKDILLYCGHGSGAQYIRQRTIRRLDRCRATVLLMGCSSGKLNDAGEFEVHGPAWNYMMAGCPAVVGTLWDVTDRDIDRLAGRMLEEWGLLPQGAFVEKGKGRSGMGKCTPDNKTKKTSLVEAVARARGAPRFRYVTAAAVVVYGIPVYVGK
ncbi:peptidase family C50-domain-containing protein [Podospora didyma]|uniref:separase n=1 Tax=Podospora didyma TaxID=330526 RepID=A0AAE0N8U1_9PEZI|nr:peptidase family C50-domain-containing protein [Podospora didyma]